ncbi:MAG TPA: DUF4783 domain-containing protein, partial [Chitinophagaceae bacterium]|nr:DUF4783 domain-containing protein [Chitinophagaceae bacterium]
MKQIFTTFLLSAMLLLSSFKAQQGIDEVVSAIKSGNATELAKYLDDNVELTLPEKYDTYSKAQALVILKDFFSNNKVKGFELKHKGTSPGGNFAIGTLQTSS